MWPVVWVLLQHGVLFSVGWEQVSRSIGEEEEGEEESENEGGERPICAMRSYVAPSPETGDCKKTSPIHQ